MNKWREVLVDNESGKKQYRCNVCGKWTKYICQDISLCSADCDVAYWNNKKKIKKEV